MNETLEIAPTALFIFNRPETTSKVFEVIRRAKPTRLFIVGDGPRRNRIGEADLCTAARAIVKKIDWECEVLTSFSKINLGCKKRLSSGLDWVFDNVDEAIIVEDDCLPHISFFRFCTDLLNKYRSTKEVMHIGGINYLSGHLPTNTSYYFSRYPHIWGWASWRRAWANYDVELKDWNSHKNRADFLELFAKTRERKFWQTILEDVYLGKIDTWDYQWAYACISRKSLAIVPSVNLVTNIGFGLQATHTHRKNRCTDMPINEIQFPLRHPQLLKRDIKADEQIQKIFFNTPGPFSYLRRILGQVRQQILKKPIL